MFHWYGFLVGIAVAVTLLLCEQRLRQEHLPSDDLWHATWWALVGGTIGARLYHVWTDWAIYQSNLVESPQIWRGGLSIIGGGIGVVIALWGWSWQRRWRRKTTHLSPLQLCDALAFAAPFGQSIGRIGNWINQELFGTPTTLPWGIFIDTPHRPTGYETVSSFHPLFAYEAVLMILFGGWLWWRYRGQKVIGSGVPAIQYVLFFTVVRFGLDFFRMQKSMITGTIFSVNQGVMAVFFLAAVIVVLQKHRRGFH